MKDAHEGPTRRSYVKPALTRFGTQRPPTKDAPARLSKALRWSVLDSAHPSDAGESRVD